MENRWARVSDLANTIHAVGINELRHIHEIATDAVPPSRDRGLLGRCARLEQVRHLAVHTNSCVNRIQKRRYHVESRLGAIAGGVERIIGECHGRGDQHNLVTQVNTPERKKDSDTARCVL